MGSMTRAVIFDCFGVLYISSRQHLLANELQHKPELVQAVHDIYRQSDYGFLSQQEVIDQVSDLSGLKRDFVASTIEGNQVMNKELLDFAQSLRPALRIGLLSNVGGGMMEHYLPAEQRQRLFDASVLSGEVGMVKPFPEIYQLMAKRLEVLPSECLFIDDSQENCEGAQAAGMTAIQYRSNLQVIAAIQLTLA